MACTIPVGLIIKDVEQNSQLDQLTVVIADTPLKAVDNYAFGFLNIPRTVKVIASNDNIDRFCYGSSVIVIDSTQKPNLVYSFPLSYYNDEKLRFTGVLKNGLGALVNTQAVELDEAFTKIGGLVVSDSAAMVCDKVIGKISVHSVDDGHKLGNFSLDSSWYYRPFINDPRLESIKKNQYILSKINYPNIKYDGLVKQDNGLVVKATCYYPLENGPDFAVLPCNVIFLLNSNNTPQNFGVVHISDTRPSFNISNAFYFNGDVFETTACVIEDRSLKFEHDFYHTFAKGKGDTLLRQSSMLVKTPKYVCDNTPLRNNHISTSCQRKLVWFNYFPEYLDVENNTWVQLDTVFLDRSLTHNSFKSKNTVIFEVFAVHPTKKSEISIFRINDKVYYLLQHNGGVKQCVQIYSISKDHALSFFVDNASTLYAIDQNTKVGDSQLIKFKIDLDIYYE